MSEEDRAKLDTLTSEQLAVVAKIVRDAEIEGGYSTRDDDGGSVWREDTQQTLNCLASFFEKYDSESIHN